MLREEKSRLISDSSKTVLNYSVRELHIDLLFLEEFYASQSFRAWFIDSTIRRELGDVLRVEHSVFELERESDLEVTFAGLTGDVLFLVENKIDAQFQTNQAVDYQSRGVEYIRRGKCSEAFTVLLAPERYIAMVKDRHRFDFYLSFEQVIAFFQSQTGMGNRAEYKENVLQKAINKVARLGSGEKQPGNSAYQPQEVNEGITQFWEKYWEDITGRYPELLMPKPGIKGPAATFIFFGKPNLPSNVELVHKFVHGCVDIQFHKLGSLSKVFIEYFKERLEPGMTIQPTGKAVVVRIVVPKINPHHFFEDLLDDVRQAQDTAKRLLSWFERQRIHLDTFNASFGEANSN